MNGKLTIHSPLMSVFNSSNKTLLKISPELELTFGEDVHPKEAADIFANYVNENFKSKITEVQKKVEELHKQIAEEFIQTASVILQNSTLQARNEELLDKLDIYDDNYMAETRKVKQLQTHLNLAVEALELITQEENGMLGYDGYRMNVRSMARTALKQIKG